MSKHIIVGGGINGLFTAYYLNRAGAEVTIVEQGDIGRESSWAGGGILSPLYPWRYADCITDLVRHSQQRYPQLCRELQEQTGIDPEYRQNGLLIQHIDDSAEIHQWCQSQQFPYEILDPSVCQLRFPAVSAIRQFSVWLPTVAQVRNPRLVKALKLLLQQRGVQLLTQERALSLCIRNHRICGVHTEKQTLSSESVCLASGAWIKTLLPDHLQHPNIVPVKGQMILLHSTPNLIDYITLRDSRYIIPRLDGHILVGSTLEHTGYDKSITQEARQELLGIARDIIPQLNNYKVVHQWAGLRPGSPHGIPTICEHPEVRGLYINGGQFRNGVVMGPASGQLMADIMLRQVTLVDVISYQLAAADHLSTVQ